MPTSFSLRRAMAALTLTCALFVGTPPAHAAEPHVVASLPPIHSLVARLLQGVAKPDLLMSSHVAGHLVELSPTQVQALRQADLVIWSGADLEGAIAEAGMVMPDLSARTLTLSNQIPVLDVVTADNPDQPSGRRDLRFWLDPRLVHHALHIIVPALVRLYPAATDTILDNEIALMHEVHHIEHTVRIALDTPEGTPVHMRAGDLRYLEWRFNLTQQGCAANSFDPIGFGLSAGPALYARLMDSARDTLLACQKRKVAARDGRSG